MFCLCLNRHPRFAQCFFSLYVLRGGVRGDFEAGPGLDFLAVLTLQ